MPLDFATSQRLRALEAEVRALKAQVDTLSAASPDAWFELGAMGEIQSFNEGYLQLFEITHSEAMNTTMWRERVPPEDLKALDEVAIRTFLEQGWLVVEFRVLVGGRLVPVKARATPKWDARKQFAGWSGIMAPQWSRAEDAPGVLDWGRPPPTPWGAWPE